MSGRPEMLNEAVIGISIVHAVTSLLVPPGKISVFYFVYQRKLNCKIRRKRKKKNIWPIQMAFVFQSKEYIYFLLTYVNFKQYF